MGRKKKGQMVADKLFNYVSFDNWIPQNVQSNF